MNRLAIHVVALLVSWTFLAVPPAVRGYPTTELCKPTRAQRVEIYQLALGASRAIEAHQEALKMEAAFRAQGMPEVARIWGQFAQQQADLERLLFIRTLEKIDEHYCIEAPPGTEYYFGRYFANPFRGRIAYFPKTDDVKETKRIVFTRSAFLGNDRYVASIKLHEVRHAWQAHNCMSSQPGFWEDDSYWGHVAEYDAYRQQELAHDSGAIRVDESFKRLIRSRMRRHSRGMSRHFPQYWAMFEQDLLRLRRGEVTVLEGKVYNPSPHMQEFAVMVEDDRGWEVFPSDPVFVTLAPEEVQTLEYMVHVPPDAPAGVNEFRLSTLPGPETMPPSSAFLLVVPYVEIGELGDVVRPVRGEEVPIEFVLTSPHPPDEPVEILVEFSNEEGWQMTNETAIVTVSAEEPATVATVLSVPEDAPSFAVGFVTLTATPLDDPGEVVTNDLAIVIEEFDLAPLLPLSPQAKANAGMALPVTATVMNLGGWGTGAPFDVTFVIEGPGEGGPVIYDERETVEGIGGREMIEVDFASVTIAAPGIYTATITALAPEGPVAVPEDVNPDNNVLTTDFEVVEPPTAVDQWGIF